MGSQSCTYIKCKLKIENYNKGFIAVGLAIGVLLSMPFISSGWVKMSTASQIYEKTEEVPQKEVALVLGAAAYGDRLSDILRDRVDIAIELYEKEKVSVIIMSGAKNEVEAMKKYAVNEEIPEEAVVKDPTGISTFISIKNIRDLKRPVIIVTQRYHLPRALYIANHMELEAVGVTADKHEYAKITDFKSREILATVNAMLKLMALD